MDVILSKEEKPSCLIETQEIDICKENLLNETKIQILISNVVNKEYFEFFKTQLICKIDDCIVFNPKMCSNCEGLFCSACCDEWQKSKNICPNGCFKDTFDYIKINRAAKQILDGLKLKCECGFESNLFSFTTHKIDDCIYSKVVCWICSSVVKQKSLKIKSIEMNKLRTNLSTIKYIYKNYAIDLSNLERNEEAIDILKKSLELDSEFESAYLYLGIINLKINNYFEGINNLFKAMEIDTFLLHPKYILMNFMYKRKEIFQEYEDILVKDVNSGNNNRSFFYLGLIYLMRTQYQESYDVFNKLIIKDPKFHLGYVGLCLVEKILYNNYEKANLYIEKALEFRPGNKFLMKNYAWLLVNQKNYHQASEYHLKLLNEDSCFSSGLLNYGHSLCEQNRDYEAGQKFSQALKIDKYYFLSMSNLAVVQIKNKNYHEATLMYYKLLELDPNFVPANKQLGNIHFNNHEYIQALSYYKKCLDYDPFNHESYRDIADCYFYLKEYEISLKNYELALKYDDKNESYKTSIESCMKKIGKYENINTHI